MCVDAAKDGGIWRVGALVPFLGVRVFRPTARGFAPQQTTKLHATVWVVCLAVKLRRSSVMVFNDSEVAIAQVLPLRAQNRLAHQ